jgi:hypothetical protein
MHLDDGPEPRLPSNPRWRLVGFENLLDMLALPLIDVTWLTPGSAEVAVESDMKPEQMAPYFVDDPDSDRFAPVVQPIRKAEYLSLTLPPLGP